MNIVPRLRHGYRADVNIATAHQRNRRRRTEVRALSPNDESRCPEPLDDGPQINYPITVRIHPSLADTLRVVTPSDAARGQLAQTLLEALFNRRIVQCWPQ